MTTLIKYRIWCSTDSKWVNTQWIDENDGAPSTCPENNGHSIDTSKTTELNRVSNLLAVDSDGCVRVVPEQSDQAKISATTFNFGDSCTWYEESVRATSVSLVADTTRERWSCPANQMPWVDICHGRLTDEDNISANAPSAAAGYALVVKVDSVTKAMATPFGTGTDGDYVPDYERGEIKFHTAVAEGSSVTADFSYVNGSKWILDPSDSKVLSINSVECQFSTNGILRDTLVFQVVGNVEDYAPQLCPDPYPAGTKIPLQTTKYKKVQDFINRANKSHPIIPAVGGSQRGLRSSMIPMVWDYRTRSDLFDSKGTEAHVYLENDIPIEADDCVITFYCTERDE